MGDDSDVLSSGSESVSGPTPQDPVPDVDHSEVPPPHRAYIGGLSNKTRPIQLIEFLKQVDPDVSHVIVAKNKGDGSCRGFAHCSFSTPQRRQQAIAQLDGTTFLGRKVRVQEAGEHFMAKRVREEGEAAAPKRSRKAIEEEASQAWEVQKGQWDEWKDSQAWDTSKRVTQGAQRRWEPGQQAAAPAKPAASARRVELEKKKAAAVAAEDYAEAAKIKKLLESEDKIDALRLKKQQAVEREDFEEAARLKKDIETLESGGSAVPEKKSKPKPAAKKAAGQKRPAEPEPEGAPAATEGAAAAAPPANAEEKKGPGPCKRCDQGKECGKHGKAARSAQQQKIEETVKAAAKAAAPPQAKKAKPAPKPAKKKSGPSSMEALLAGS